MSFDPAQPQGSQTLSPESLEALGSLLRQTREARGLSLSEASHDTFIRTQYLAALERADLSQLPEVVYVQGFLKRYADYLGLPGETLQKHSLVLFQNPKAPTSSSSAPPLNTQEPVAIPLRPMHLWTIYVVVVVFAVGVLSALLEGRSTSFTQWISRTSSPAPQEPTPQPRQPQTPQESTPDQDPAAASTPTQPTPQPTITAVATPVADLQSPEPRSLAEVFSDPDTVGEIDPAATEQPVKLDIRVVERPSWLRVIADGQVEFEGTLQPGAERNWSATQSIVLRAGNAGGVLITLNDQDLGVMGRFGEVREETYP